MSRPKGTKNKPKELAGAVPTPIYTARIKVLGAFHDSTGFSVFDALANLKVPLGRGVSVIALAKGEKRQEKVFNGFQTARLFSPSPLQRQIALKQTALRYDL